MLILVYTIPNIYVFLRVLNLFISRKNKLKYTFVYLMLASLYPVSVYQYDGNFLSGLIEKISEYLVPFFLYFFLFILLFDIFLLLNLFVKIISKEKRRSPEFKRRVLSLLILSSVIIVVAGIVNFNTIRVSEYNIKVEAGSSQLQHLKIAFASDFHLGKKASVKFVAKFAEKISEIKPDIVLFGGDIAEGENESEKMISFENILKEIKPRYGFFTVLGNHEYYSGHDDGYFFRKAGIEILYDDVTVIDNAFNLVGRLDAHYRGRKTIDELLNSTNDSLPVIMIDHRPSEILEVSKTDTDVQFSGHTHNGQMFPINLIIRRLYELGWGYKKIENTHFFVSSGIRLWGPQVRTAGKSEIMVVNIEFADM
jgi:predicted MPP superfamily phosphohydrolase